MPKIIDSFVEEIEGEKYNFLVLERIDGLTLRNIIKNYDVPFLRTLSWAKQLLDILIYLQTSDRQIIHKDICPNNIIIDDSNKVYLIDFGISKKANNFDYITGGTENYMPPEQFVEDGITDFYSDIYSFSATIYHLLTGEKPKKSIDRKNAVENKLPDPLIPLPELCKNLPRSLSELIQKGMSIEPDSRPRNALKMRKELIKIEKSISFQEFLHNAESFEPEIITITAPTKLKPNFSKIEIPIKPPKSVLKKWGINNIKKGSEASYSLYFLEDALEAEKDEREFIKDRFISVIGRERIDDDTELSKLLSILESLCKNNVGDDEIGLADEIVFHKAELETNEPSDKSANPNMIGQFYKENPRKVKLYVYRSLLFVILLLFFLTSFLIWYLYPSPQLDNQNSNSVPTPSPTLSKTYIGKKGKIGKNANIRQEASQDSNRIGILYTDSEVEILDMQQNDSKGKPTIWFKVKVVSYGCSKDIPSKCGKDNPSDAEIGWISNQFITGLQ